MSGKIHATLERVRQLYRDAQAAQGEIGERITAKREELQALTALGTVSADEAYASWSESFDAYAETGRAIVERGFKGFTRPHHPDPFTGSVPARPRASAGFELSMDSRGRPITDPGAITAFIHRDQIGTEAREYFARVCAEPTVPVPAEREEQIAALAREIEELEAERLAIGDELSTLFARPEVIYAKSAKDRDAAMVDALNAKIEQRNAEIPEQRPSPVRILQGAE